MIGRLNLTPVFFSISAWRISRFDWQSGQTVIMQSALTIRAASSISLTSLSTVSVFEMEKNEGLSLLLAFILVKSSFVPFSHLKMFSSKISLRSCALLGFFLFVPIRAIRG